MVPHDRPPPVRVHRQLDRVAGPQHAAGDLDQRARAAVGVLGVQHAGRQSRRGELAGVADLAAALGVERGLVEDRQAALAGGQRRWPAPCGPASARTLAPEASSWWPRNRVGVGAGPPRRAPGPPRAAGCCPRIGRRAWPRWPRESSRCSANSSREPRSSTRAAAARREVPDQVDRHAVGGEQRERVLAADLEARAGASAASWSRPRRTTAAEVPLLARPAARVPGRRARASCG